MMNLFNKVYRLLLTAFLISATQTINVSASTDTALLPTVLSAADIQTYRRIFELQAKGKWVTSGKLLKKLENDILLGHVKFQKYMHPTKYRSRYAELAGWMKRYNDHPSAWQVYNLARKRRGKARYPRRPAEMRYPGVTGQEAKSSPATPARLRSERKAISRFKGNVRRYVRRGEPEKAEKRYWGIEATKLLTAHESAEALAKIASSYYYEGDDFKAIALATHGAELSGTTVALSDWIAGLANFRGSNFVVAHEHFKAVAVNDNSTEWLMAAGHFWAGRTGYLLSDPEAGEDHMFKAAELSETFYGLIAAKHLGIVPKLDWTMPALDDASIDRLMKHSAIRRAIALSQVGRGDLADEELRLLWGRKGIAVQKDVMALSVHMNLPAIQMRLGRVGGIGEPVPTSVRFPIPDWVPADGFRLDKAVLFGIVRQESVFRMRAKSSVGARGLMQVMPATARYLSRKNPVLRKNRHRLSEPEFNMALGQQYVSYLANMDDVQGNLLMLLAAYNAGPGTLNKWHKSVAYAYDPLLFIESIGFHETRNFIERVMSNIWIYRYKLGQTTPSLDALAAGAWPPLEYLDQPGDQAANTPRWRKAVVSTVSTASED